MSGAGQDRQTENGDLIGAFAHAIRLREVPQPPKHAAQVLYNRSQWTECYNNVLLFCRLLRTNIDKIQTFTEIQPYINEQQLRDFLVAQIVQMNTDLQRQLKSYETTCEEYLLRLQDLYFSLFRRNLLIICNNVADIY